MEKRTDEGEVEEDADIDEGFPRWHRPALR